MMKEIIVISLFNGMGCAWIAFDKCGIKVVQRISSEIDKYAITVNDKNYPDTLQVGDVSKVRIVKSENGNKLFYGSDNKYIDLLNKEIFLCGGSPCQSFSFAGKRKGMATKCELQILSLSHYLELKEQNFEFEGQSYLFWEYMRILEEIRVINPDVKFLLENVLMGSYWQKVLSVAIGINPIMINSALLSAQNRKRLYFTNIGAESDGLFGDLKCMIPQPKDKGILLRDVLESEVDEKYYLSDKALLYINAAKFRQDRIVLSPDEKSVCLQSARVENVYAKIDKQGKIKNNQDKASCFTAGGNSGRNHSDMDLICVASRGRNPENPKSREPGLNTKQQLEARNDGKTNCLTSVQKDNLIVHNMMPHSSKSCKGGTGHLTRQDGKTYCLDTGNTNAVEVIGCDYRTDEGIRYRNNGKSGTLAARARNDESCGQLASINSRIRRLTPLECERLQTVPDNYTNHVSDSQRYKMLGNGWTVDVVAYIFSYYKP